MIDFFKNLFGKTEVNVNPETGDKSEEKPEDKKELNEIPEGFTGEELNEALKETTETTEIKTDNPLLQIDIQSLSLDKIQRETDAFNSYLKMLVKDLANYEDMQNKQTISNGISAKIKHIVIHGLELKNLLGIIEDNYYNNLINNLKETNNPKFNEIIEELENDRKSLIDLENDIGRLIDYDSKLNSEKNPEYMKAIEETAKNRDLSNDLNKLMNEIMNVIIGSGSIKSKIERNNIQERIRNL